MAPNEHPWPIATDLVPYAVRENLVLKWRTVTDLVISTCMGGPESCAVGAPVYDVTMASYLVLTHLCGHADL